MSVNDRSMFKPSICSSTKHKTGATIQNRQSRAAVAQCTRVEICYHVLTVETHASAVKDDRLLVNDLVVCSEPLLALGHDGTVDKLTAADVIVNEFFRFHILGQSLDIVLTLLQEGNHKGIGLLARTAIFFFAAVWTGIMRQGHDAENRVAFQRASSAPFLCVITMRSI